MNTRLRFFAFTSAVVTFTFLGIGLSVPAQAVPIGETYTSERYAAYLQAQCLNDPDGEAGDVKAAFAKHTRAQKEIFMSVLSCPDLLSELLDSSQDSVALPFGESVVKETRSEMFPNLVINETTVESTATSAFEALPQIKSLGPNKDSGLQIAPTSLRASSVAPKFLVAQSIKSFPSNSTATGTYTAIQRLFNIPITTLKVWVTFTTGSVGVPMKILSSGSSNTNFNFGVNVSSTNNKPYLELPAHIAVASTTWHGHVLYKGFGASFDRVQTGKFYAGGLYHGSLV